MRKLIVDFQVINCKCTRTKSHRLMPLWLYITSFMNHYCKNQSWGTFYCPCAIQRHLCKSIITYCFSFCAVSRIIQSFRLNDVDVSFVGAMTKQAMCSSADDLCLSHEFTLVFWGDPLPFRRRYIGDAEAVQLEALYESGRSASVRPIWAKGEGCTVGRVKTCRVPTSAHNVHDAETMYINKL